MTAILSSPAPAQAGSSRAERDAELLARAVKVADDVVATHAADVDATGRFPSESFAAIRAAGLLGAYVPQEFGGSGCSVPGITAIGHALAQRCASTGMVYAMHQIQVACLVHNGQHLPAVREILADIAAEKALLASATTEAGIGGDLGSSNCHVERLDGGRYRLVKDAPVISYADDADVIVATAKRTAESPQSDQVLAIAKVGPGTLEKRGTWDALGMRGTCSHGYLLDMGGPAELILDTPYAEMSVTTMMPMAHLTWSGVWIGIALDAVNTARRYLRTQARKTPGKVPSQAPDVAALFARYEALKAMHDAALADYQALLDRHLDHESRMQAMGTPGFSLRLLMLKTTTSEEALKIVQQAMHTCGIAAYSNNTPFSLGRHLRDAHSAPLMVHNERVFANAGALLCIYKEG